MLNPSPVVPPTSPRPLARPARAYTTLFWFLVLGQVLATFTALMAVGMLLATARPVVRWRVPLPPVTTVAPVDTTGWQTYRNEELGFVIRYPATWQVVRGLGEVVLQTRDKMGQVNEIYIGVPSVANFAYLQSGTSVGEQYLAGISWRAFFHQENNPGELANFRDTLVLITEYGDQWYYIKLSPHPNSGFSAPFLPILSTLRLLGQADTTGWQTYRNDWLEFKYPVEWKAQRISLSYTKFTNESGVEMAALRCPVPETGYEVWDFTQESRTMKKSGVMYEARFDYGTPTYNDAEGDIALIYFFDVDAVRLSGFLGGLEGTCQLSRYDARGYYGIFKAIYDSLVVDPS